MNHLFDFGLYPKDIIQLGVQALPGRGEVSEGPRRGPSDKIQFCYSLI